MSGSITLTLYKGLVFCASLHFMEGAFTCPSDGLFPDPVTCDGFYSCAFGRAYLMRCPVGTLFNPEIGICDHAYDVSCIVTPSGTVYLKKTDVAILNASAKKLERTNASMNTASGETLSPSACYCPRLTSVQEVSEKTEGLGASTHELQLKGQKSRNNTFVRGCYFTNWSQYRPGDGKYLPENYEDGLCDYIFFAFASMKNTFEITNFEWNDLDILYPDIAKLKSRDSNLKTLLSIGGWTFGTQKFKRMASNPESRRIFVKSAVTYLRRYNFDGLDIDWEYPENEKDKNSMVMLFQDLMGGFARENVELRRPRLLLTAAVSASHSKIDTVYDVPKLAKLLDFVNLMSYDFHGSWDLTTGANSPLFAHSCGSCSSSSWSVAGAAAHWNARGMPRKKIMIGLPTYGRGWLLKNASMKSLGSPASGPSSALKYTGESGIASYYECCEMLSQGAERYWNNETKTPYLIKDDQWFSYDDEESFVHKTDWIMKEGYGGAFVWSLDMDDFAGVFCANDDGGKRYPLIRLLKALIDFS
uniref:Chitin-binding type-2 domain-containing protein n=1 Tax=Trichuris muris TaxID=70415 RepID=A0A5S6Q0U9_TRIMR